MAVRGRPKVIDDETQLALYSGLTVSQLARAYGVDPTDLRQRLAGIRPAGDRNGMPLYKLKDIAPVMWRPTEKQIDDRMHHLHHSQLPKTLTKEYWSGKRSKQEYQIRAGQLYSTSRVVESVGELLKMVRMNLTLMSDTVERQVELTERQRRIIKDVTDAALTELRRAIIEKFSTATEKDLRDDEDTYQDEYLRDEHSGGSEIERVDGSNGVDDDEL